MSSYKRRWWHNIFLEFYLNIPFLRIETRMFNEAMERFAYDICRVNIKLYKWSWEFKLYKKPDLYYRTDLPPEPSKPTKLQRLSKWLTRKRTLSLKRKLANKDNGGRG